MEASDQFEAAVERIQQDKRRAAQKLAQTVADRIEQLATLPGLGRLGEIGGTRELVSPPYVVICRYTDEVIEILQIWHGAQNWR